MLLQKNKQLTFLRVERTSPLGTFLLQEIRALRKEVYNALGWIIDSKSDETKMVWDDFDDAPTSTHFCMIEEGAVIGAHRMTRYSEKYALPYIADGHPQDIFNLALADVSEANRLIMKRDKKYPGAAKQLLHNTTKFELENHAQSVVSIGNPDHTDFFSFMGYKPRGKEFDVEMDSNNAMQLLRKGVPIAATSESVNESLDLDKYGSARSFVVIS